MLDDHLSEREFFVTDRYTIADVAIYGYSHRAHEAGIDMQPYASLGAWFEAVERAARLPRGRRAVRRERDTRHRSLDLRRVTG